MTDIHYHTDDQGIIRYTNSVGEPHRTDGPAVICPDGKKYWYLNDALHRTDGPAVIFPDGEERWCHHGKIHREDGPAIIYPGGNTCWGLNGTLMGLDQFIADCELSEDEKIMMRIRTWGYVEISNDPDAHTEAVMIST